MGIGIIGIHTLPLARVYFLYGNDDPDLFIRRIFAAGNHGQTPLELLKKPLFSGQRLNFG
ncbi:MULTISPECIES: hypothetical protein [unclassified Acinetobacter]|uniref:hypothetical protein n=1 Tax=unclassified Acinetobacter TaxID=196816 RepID=UPI0015D11BE7|nr:MULTISPECIES: hypothetical protein [unclassified Acinetobacter]